MLADFYDPKQAPLYMVLLIQGLKFTSSWIWQKSETNQQLSERLTETQRLAKEAKSDAAGMAKRLDDGNAELSKKMSELQAHLGKIDVLLAEVKTELLLTRGYRREGA